VVKTVPKKEAPKPELKKVEPKKVTPKPAPQKPVPKPKTLEERMAEVRKGGKTIQTAPVASQPALDYSGLKSALNRAASGTGSGTGSGSGGGAYSPFGWYYDRVKQQMYSVWQQPTGAPIGLTASATIQIGGDGTVYSKSITRRSGNSLFDQSVQSALNATTRLPVPPADLPSRTIEIEFALSN
jgi:TonB family protein